MKIQYNCTYSYTEGYIYCPETSISNYKPIRYCFYEINCITLQPEDYLIDYVVNNTPVYKFFLTFVPTYFGSRLSLSFIEKFSPYIRYDDGLLEISNQNVKTVDNDTNEESFNIIRFLTILGSLIGLTVLFVVLYKIISPI